MVEKQATMYIVGQKGVRKDKDKSDGVCGTYKDKAKETAG